MGYPDVEVPELPVEKLATKDPLRAAILAWIAATGSIVPPEELERELARADALPIDVQRDIALLLLSASEATLMQRAALARLEPWELDWIYANPQVAEDLARGVDTVDTRYMAMLAGKVDMEQSLKASLLLLEAVEVTRGSLSQAEASRTMGALAANDIDDTTRSVLQLLASVPAGASDKDKLLLAARLVSVTAGIPMPSAPVGASFRDALAALLAQTNQVPESAALAEVHARAEALPLDLQRALATLLLAQANAVQASHPAHLTP
ncbi:MAG TPA: hypothetical protein VFH78_01240, partial [Candidatus Thermoplasmatota archaeon]|nr:hypothetical protein [Candidatus Thermoplasmatota archaeon]